MTLTNYISTTDDLEVRFKEYDIPIVRRLSNGVEFEFDDEYKMQKHCDIKRFKKGNKISYRFLNCIKWSL